MQEVLQWGADFIVRLQQFDMPLLNQFFETLTWFGGIGYLFMIPLVLWCFDYRLGASLMAVFVVSAVINFFIKDIVALDRPFMVDARIISAGEHGYSMPSGHAQLVVAFWGVLAAWVAQRWFWLLALAIMLLMGFSRIYLGVHYPSDVLVGWLLGGLTLMLWMRHRDALENWARELGFRRQLVVVSALAAVLLLPAVGFSVTAMTFGGIGLLWGAGVAMALVHRAGEGRDPGPWPLRLLSFAVAMPLTLLLIGLLQRLPAVTGLGNAPSAFLALCLLGLWMLWLVPSLSRRLQRVPVVAQGWRSSRSSSGS